MITININKAKDIAHDLRRAKRSEEFAPYDEVISKQIPGTAAADAEAARQVIREKYVAMQAEIESAESVEVLKVALGAS